MNFLTNNRKGQMGIGKVSEILGPISLAFVVAVIMVAVEAIIVWNIQTVAYDSTSITGEAHDELTTPFPDTFTVNDFGQGVEERSETLIYEDASASSNTTLKEETDYNSVSYGDGEFEVLNSTILGNYNDTEDVIYIDYNKLESNDSSNVLSKGDFSTY
mgnify:CR=1 FL=1